MPQLSIPGVAMDSEIELSKYWCPRKDCKDYGKTGKGNIIIKEKYDKEKRWLLAISDEKPKNQMLDALSSNLRFDLFNFVSGLDYVLNHIFDRRNFSIFFQDQGIFLGSTLILFIQFLVNQQMMQYAEKLSGKSNNSY